MQTIMRKTRSNCDTLHVCVGEYNEKQSPPYLQASSKNKLLRCE